MTTMYVAVWNERPIGVSADHGAVQVAAIARESKYDREPREYRWDAHPGGDYWDLMVLNTSTRRWNRTTTTVVAAPVVDGTTSEECPR